MMKIPTMRLAVAVARVSVACCLAVFFQRLLMAFFCGINLIFQWTDISQSYHHFCALALSGIGHWHRLSGKFEENLYTFIHRTRKSSLEFYF